MSDRVSFQDSITVSYNKLQVIRLSVCDLEIAAHPCGHLGAGKCADTKQIVRAGPGNTCGSILFVYRQGYPQALNALIQVSCSVVRCRLQSDLQIEDVLL